MANMRDVNKAIKAAFPDLKIELVRGNGYAYFNGDDGYDKFESIAAHPTVTATADMVRLALDTIETTLEENAAFDAKVAEDVAKFKAASEVPAGEHLVVFESSDNEKLKVLIVGGGAHHGRCIATLAVLGFAPMPVQPHRSFTMGSKITYSVHRTVKLGRFEVLADNEQIAEFVVQADAYDFVDLCQARDEKALGVKPVASAVVASDRSEYALGGDAYEAGSPYDMDRSQDWRDGWEDTKDLLEQGK